VLTHSAQTAAVPRNVSCGRKPDGVSTPEKQPLSLWYLVAKNRARADAARSSPFPFFLPLLSRLLGVRLRLAPQRYSLLTPPE
jgi:hypothetical protein